MVQPASRFVGVPHQYGRSDIIDNAEEAIDVDTDAADDSDDSDDSDETDQPAGAATTAMGTESMVAMRRAKGREDIRFLADTLRELQGDLYLALWAILGISGLFIALLCSMCLCPCDDTPYDEAAERRLLAAQRAATTVAAHPAAAAAAKCADGQGGVFVVVMDGPIVEPVKPPSIRA